MTLEQIVNVTISRETAVPSQVGFGVGAFLSDDALFSPRAKSYSSVEDVTADPLAGSKLKAFAAIYFSQEVRPTELVAIKKKVDRYWIGKITLDADLITGNTIAGEINSTVVSVPFDTDHDTTMSNLATALAADGQINTAIVTSSREITLTGDTYGEQSSFTDFAVTGGASQAEASETIAQYADTEGSIVASLDESLDVNDDWYGLAIYSRVDADLEAVAAWVEPKFKIFFAVSNTAAVLTAVTTDVASKLTGLAYDRTYIAFSALSSSYVDAAIMGRQLPQKPGSSTYAYKNLKGIAADSLTGNQKGIAHGKNVNTYTKIAGVGYTEQGKVASGEFLDIIIGGDYIVSQLKEKVFSQFANSEKIPFTDEGAAVIEVVVRQVLTNATNLNILAASPAYTVSIPLVENVSTQDKQNRRLPDINWQATRAGAIHGADIKGRLVL